MSNRDVPRRRSSKKVGSAKLPFRDDRRDLELTVEKVGRRGLTGPDGNWNLRCSKDGSC